MLSKDHQQRLNYSDKYKVEKRNEKAIMSLFKIVGPVPQFTYLTLAKIGFSHMHFLRSRLLYMSNMHVGGEMSMPDLYAINHGMSFQMGSYGSMWLHMNTGESHVAQDHFWIPLDRRKVQKSMKKRIPKTKKVSMTFPVKYDLA